MKRMILSLSLLCLFVSAAALSDDRIARIDKQQTVPSLKDISPDAAADIWLYEQQWQRHDDPKQAVRRNAEFRGAQRRYRLASLMWFGLSNSRPMVSPVPTMGVYSPTWAASVEDPFRWVGGGYPTIALYVDEVRPAK